MKGKNEGERERIKTAVLPQGKETVLVSDGFKSQSDSILGPMMSNNVLSRKAAL